MSSNKHAMDGHATETMRVKNGAHALHMFVCSTKTKMHHQPTQAAIFPCGTHASDEVQALRISGLQTKFEKPTCLKTNFITNV